jgi:hypothetical protein
MKPRLFKVVLGSVIGLVLFSTHNPAQLGPAFPPGTPLPFVQGPTLIDTVRNAAQATSDQARIAAQTATEMGRRARSAGYQSQNFAADYPNLQLQFQNLRATFNLLAGIVPQLQSARAANAAAELDAGLNIIAEAFTPVEQEWAAGNLDRRTIVQMCEILNEAILEWQKELKKNSRRLGTIR